MKMRLYRLIAKFSLHESFIAINLEQAFNLNKQDVHDLLT